MTYAEVNWFRVRVARASANVPLGLVASKLEQLEKLAVADNLSDLVASSPVKTK